MNKEMISFSQRMKKKNNEYVGSYDPRFDVIAQETFSEKGRVLKRSVVKTTDNAEFMAQYSPDDFRIENLVAVGALQDGKRYTYNPTRLDMMDAIESGFDILTDIADMNNNVNNTNE